MFALSSTPTWTPISVTLQYRDIDNTIQHLVEEQISRLQQSSTDISRPLRIKSRSHSPRSGPREASPQHIHAGNRGVPPSIAFQQKPRASGQSTPTQAPPQKPPILRLRTKISLVSPVVDFNLAFFPLLVSPRLNLPPSRLQNIPRRRRLQSAVFSEAAPSIAARTPPRVPLILPQSQQWVSSKMS